jgi:2-polyprenyl-3-methyl-5-hydroxy-6-metoxy-1,4-benzoquinol methylase
MQTVPPDLAQLKSGIKAAWMAGDFGQIAKVVSGEAENFVARLDLKPGARVLDVACGTGNSAIPAARAGAHVTGVDAAGQATLAAQLEALWTEQNTATDGTTAVEGEYLEVHAIRA